MKTNRLLLVEDEADIADLVKLNSSLRVTKLSPRKTVCRPYKE